MRKTCSSHQRVFNRTINTAIEVTHTCLIKCNSAANCQSAGENYGYVCYLSPRRCSPCQGSKHSSPNQQGSGHTGELQSYSCFQFPVKTADSRSRSSVFQIKYTKCQKLVYRMLITAVIVLTLIVEDYLKIQDFGEYFPHSLEGMWYLSVLQKWLVKFSTSTLPSFALTPKK